MVGNGRCRSWAPSGSSALGLAGRRREAARSAACWPHGAPQHGPVACIPGPEPGCLFSRPRRRVWGRGLSLQPPGLISGAEPSPATVAGPRGSRDAGRRLPLSPDGAPASCFLPSCPRSGARSARSATACSLRVTRHVCSSPLHPVSCLGGQPGGPPADPAQARLHLLLCSLYPKHLPLPLPTPSRRLAAPLSPASLAAAWSQLWSPCARPAAVLLGGTFHPSRRSLPRPPGRPQSRRTPGSVLCPVRSLLLDVTQARCSSRAQFLAGPWDVAVGLTPESSCAGRSIQPGEILGPVSPSLLR